MSRGEIRLEVSSLMFDEHDNVHMWADRIILPPAILANEPSITELKVPKPEIPDKKHNIS